MSSAETAPPRDWMRLLARVLCAFFAILGLLPIALGFVAKSPDAQRWVTRETQRLLQRELSLSASYEIELSLWPFRVELSKLEIAASDGKGPALVLDRLTVAPRVFSLMDGRIDVGEVEVEGARGRLVVEGGRLMNVVYRVPEAAASPASRRAPFSSLSLSDAELELRVDGIDVHLGSVDLDVFPEAGSNYEVALRIGESRVAVPQERYPENPHAAATWDSDVLCQLDARVRIEPQSFLIRRLSLIGAADIDPRAGTIPDCANQGDDDPGRVALRANQLRLTAGDAAAPWLVQGDILARVPIDLANRVAPAKHPFRGWLALHGQVRYDGSTRLPQYQGKLKLGELEVDDKVLLQGADGDVEILGDEVVVPRLSVKYGTGNVEIEDVRFSPFAPGTPLFAKSAVVSKVPFPNLMQNLRITNDTIVYFMIETATLEDFGGTLSPLKLDGNMAAEVTNFEIFRGSHKSPARKHMFGLNSRGFTRGTFSVRPGSVQFNDQHVHFGTSSLFTNVHVGTSEGIFLETWQSKIDLADVTPLLTIPMKGVLRFDARMEGARSDPLLTSELSIEGLDFGGFPIGDLERSKLSFRPLWLELDAATLKKGESRIQLPKVRFDFDAGPDLEIQATAKSEKMRVVDFFSMWHFEKDPLWQDVNGLTAIDARIHYTMGGPSDHCGGGVLLVDAALDMAEMSMFGESYDGGHVEGQLRWTDREASYHGLELDVPTVELRKGSGTILGNFQLSPGAKVRGNIVATGIPLNELDALGKVNNVALGSLSSVIQVSGTLDQMSAQAQIDVGPVVVGRSQLLPSTLHVALEPAGPSTEFVPDSLTGCGRKIPLPGTTSGEGEGEDVATGKYTVSGSLFGGQVALDGLTITQQRSQVLKGRVAVNQLDLGPMLELVPEIALLKERPSAKLSADIDIASWPLDNFAGARATAQLTALQARFRDLQVRVEPSPKVELEGGGVAVEQATLRVVVGGGAPTTLELSGAVRNLHADPSLDAAVRLRPLALAAQGTFPGTRRVEGTLEGQIRVTGPLDKPSYSGGLRLEDGLVEFRGAPMSLSDVQVSLKLDNEGLNIERATAAMGSGAVSATGTVPLRGFRPGAFQGQVVARDIALPLTAGVEITVDAELEGSWNPNPTETGEPALPKIGGEVLIKSFEYTRAVTMNADIATLTGRPKRTQFESYDPDKDLVELDVLITSKGSLQLNNNLIEANLDLEPPGLRLTGTNQRFGLRGSVKVLPGGRIRFRRNDFEVQSGEVQFEDATRVSPRVDVTAVTDYRRFSNTTQSGVSTSAATSTSAQSAAGSTAGQWRISMHAHGDAENLKLDLTSQPKLSQDDIFLLLTVGLTRAELDQAQSASVGESVALEALGSLTGADSAVSEAIPAIDEFRLGSSYSARTGRTEPTVTVGKRLSERIRAYVTSGISESREVRSNLEWRLKPGVSVEGSYDNVNDVSSSNLGNLGADIRWRLEFE
jgi:translocation and assembly module TamB